MKRSPIEVFNEWATLDKDFGMEQNHKRSVENMLTFALKQNNSFSFIDAGCGNGWVVRYISKLKECRSAIGIDGSLEMIKKAKSLDTVNSYKCDDLISWIPENRVDLVHSMEVFYYFKDPLKLIKHIFNSWLKNKSRLIVGMDFYKENKVSHSWPEKTGVSIMELISENTWKEYFKESGFKNIKSWKVGKKENWEGTLIITGIKHYE